MDTVVGILVTCLQIALTGLLIWGASLCLRDLLARPHPPRQAADLEEVARAEQHRFERVASLVLLALLCTTVAGLA